MLLGYVTRLTCLHVIFFRNSTGGKQVRRFDSCDALCNFCLEVLCCSSWRSSQHSPGLCWSCECCGGSREHWNLGSCDQGGFFFFGLKTRPETAVKGFLFFQFDDKWRWRGALCGTNLVREWNSFIILFCYSLFSDIILQPFVQFVDKISTISSGYSRALFFILYERL